MRKTIFLCRPLPFPAQSGGALRELGLLKQLSQIMPLEVFSILPAGESATPSLEHFPFQTTFLPNPRKSFFRRALSPFLAYPLNEYSTAVIDQLEKSFTPGSILWISRLALGSYIEPAKKMGYRVVLDQHNVESDYYLSSVKINHKWLEFPLALQLQQIEKNICLLADQIVVTSERDKYLLEKLCGPLPIHTVPNCIEKIQVEVLNSEPINDAGPNELLFVGTLDYSPNAEGLHWFLQFVFPKVRGYELQVVGARPSSKLKILLQRQAKLVANASSLEPFYQKATVCIAPLLSGGGTRIKILEALSWGKPVVATKKAAEGLGLQPGVHYLEANDPQDFADALEILRLNPGKGKDLAANGQELLKEKYLWEAQLPLLKKILVDTQ